MEIWTTTTTITNTNTAQFAIKTKKKIFKDQYNFTMTNIKI